MEGRNVTTSGSGCQLLKCERPLPLAGSGSAVTTDRVTHSNSSRPRDYFGNLFIESAVRRLIDQSSPGECGVSAGALRTRTVKLLFVSSFIFINYKVHVMFLQIVNQIKVVAENTGAR